MTDTWHILLCALLFLTFESLAQKSIVENEQPTPKFNASDRLSGDVMSFFVLGDWGTGGKGQKQVANGLASKMRQDGATALFTTGNNFYGQGVASTDDIQWETTFERMYLREELDIPFYAVLGTQDYGLKPDAQVSYTGKRLRDGTITRWNMPSRYWTTAFQSPGSTVSVRVIGLDTEQLIGPDTNSRSIQLRWLDSVLQQPGEEWRIVVGHHPVFSNGMRGNTISLIQHLKPILERGHVQLYFAGRDHDLQLLEPLAGVTYVISGGGGSSRNVRWAKNTIFAATNLGFVWFQLSKEYLLLHFLDAEGNLLYAQKLHKDAR